MLRKEKKKMSELITNFFTIAIWSIAMIYFILRILAIIKELKEKEKKK